MKTIYENLMESIT